MDREREANRVVWVGADHMELTLAPGSEKGKKQVGGVEGLLQRKSGLSPETTCVLFDPRKPLPVFCPMCDMSAAALSLS